MPGQPSASRYHALDGLRAAMMFLGIYLHAVVAYSPRGLWFYKPLDLTPALDWTTTVIHVFRMPVFYVMAGFFAALLLQRYGVWRATKNRVVRIVVPFVVGCIVIVPVFRFLLPRHVRDGLHRLFRLVVQSSWAPLPLAALSFLALLPMRYPG